MRFRRSRTKRCVRPFAIKDLQKARKVARVNLQPVAPANPRLRGLNAALRSRRVELSSETLGSKDLPKRQGCGYATMMENPRPLRAIDLYSGVGGWSLGLRLAGIDVVASYERWGPANETNFKNNHHQAHTIDIRRLSLEDLPSDIDLVVGSPPCTQFSFSNRGGNGDLDDGFTDIIKFLEVVDYLRPTAWVMENVPRIARIVESELCAGGKLERFQHLGVVSNVVNMEEYGVPQRRKRCLVGNIDFDLLKSYSAVCPRYTLKQIIDAMSAPVVVDPIYGVQISRADLRDQCVEVSLNEEEERINRAGKVSHPVYNRMPFPDRLDRSVRTITATCTRVSRESIVIDNPQEPGRLRRLTVRERASLQGFPVSYQFYAASTGLKMRMVGNALPPPLAYLIGNVVSGTLADGLPPIANSAGKLTTPSPLAEDTVPDRAGATYRPARPFRFAIPSLRLASGVRFDFANNLAGQVPTWSVAFIFGTSKAIHTMDLSTSLYARLISALPYRIKSDVLAVLDVLGDYIGSADIVRMQAVWSHSGPGATRPFMLFDEINAAGEKLQCLLAEWADYAAQQITAAISAEYGEAAGNLPGREKLGRNSVLVMAGFLVGCRANIEIEQRHPAKVHQLEAVISN